jgi:hypothetical protein
MSDQSGDVGGQIIAYRVSADLAARIEAAAADEGISKSDVARRAVLRDLARAKQSGATA